MAIGYVAQSQAKLTAAEQQVNEAQEKLRMAHSNLSDLKKQPASPDRELAIIAQEAYIASLSAMVKDQAGALEAVRQEHTNVLASRRRQVAFIEQSENELKTIQHNDPARLFEFETALRDLIETHAKGITYARDFSNALDQAENERRAVSQIVRKLERNRATLIAYDGEPEAMVE